jgi:hypothetical protein
VLQPAAKAGSCGANGANVRPRPSLLLDSFELSVKVQAGLCPGLGIAWDARESTRRSGMILV